MKMALEASKEAHFFDEDNLFLEITAEAIGVSIRPSEPPPESAALYESGASQKRIAIRMINTLNPVSRTP